MSNITDMLKEIKILYVEDEEITRIITKKILKRYAGKIVIGKNGQEGLELFEKHKPDIVLTDLRMPILDGIDMIKGIREFDDECGIIINTQIEDIDYIIKSVDIGIDKYIVKPVEDEIILDALRKVFLKVIKRRKDKKAPYNILNLQKEDKLAIENKIKTDISSFMKKTTGKGPKDIKVSFLSNEIEVIAKGILTPMEKIVLQNKSNFMLVEYYRGMFFEQLEEELIRLIEDIVKVSVKVNKVHTSPKEDVQKITFELKIAGV